MRSQFSHNNSSSFPPAPDFALTAVTDGSDLDVKIIIVLCELCFVVFVLVWFCCVVVLYVCCVNVVLCFVLLCCAVLCIGLSFFVCCVGFAMFCCNCVVLHLHSRLHAQATHFSWTCRSLVVRSLLDVVYST
jgi:hypothetical protein